ncbi:hypothetical protein [Rhodococcus ruber]|uniref:hypothetical protein n=1 Tax=Rhodococcus ruber TaxID=1830 RepID=UPI003784BBEB
MAVRYELRCDNGDRWELSMSAGPVKLHDDPDGVEGAEFSFDDQQDVDQPGVTFRARMFAPNLIGLDCKVGPVRPGVEACELLARWRRSLGNGVQLHEFHAISDWGGDRFQVVRLAGKLPKPPMAQMRAAGVVLHDKVTLRSDESWWRKRPAVRTFTPAEFAGAVIVSESEEPVWPHFVIRGPITLPTIGVAGEAVPLPTIPAGDEWTVETDPNWFAITDGTGADRSWVGRRWYTRAPAVAAGSGGSVDVPVTITGTGTTAQTSVTVTLPQLFYGAF